MEECKSTALDLCELEALRPEDHKCGAASGCYTLSFVPYLEDFNSGKRMPGFSSIAASDWKGNSAGSYNEATWSMSTSGCDQCANKAVKPSCALPAKCQMGVRVCTLPQN